MMSGDRSDSNSAAMSMNTRSTESGLLIMLRFDSSMNSACPTQADGDAVCLKFGQPLVDRQLGSSQGNALSQVRTRR